jgi:transcription antitermination factor NusG
MAMRWYVIHVYSGFEKKVAQSIKEQASKGMADLIEEVLVPTEEVVEMRAARRSAPSASSSRATCCQDGDDRRDLAPGEEHAEGHRVPRRRMASRRRSPTARPRTS